MAKCKKSGVSFPAPMADPTWLFKNEAVNIPPTPYPPKNPQRAVTIAEIKLVFENIINKFKLES